MPIIKQVVRPIPIVLSLKTSSLVLPLYIVAHAFYTEYSISSESLHNLTFMLERVQFVTASSIRDLTIQKICLIVGRLSHGEELNIELLRNNDDNLDTFFTFY